MNFKILGATFAVLFLSSCLKTRSEVNGNYQSGVYSKKQADNQRSQPQTSLEPSETVAKFDERDETIRTLNGRVETLENQLASLQKEKQENTDAQKVQILQEAAVKMEAQIAKLEAELSAKPSDSNVSSVTPVAGKNSAAKTSFDSAQEFFAKKDFKNAILEYQKFVDANSKSKNKEVVKLIPEAKYKIGLSFEAMGLKDEARSFYEEVAAQHGSTEFGKKAKLKVSKSKK